MEGSAGAKTLRQKQVGRAGGVRQKRPSKGKMIGGLAFGVGQGQTGRHMQALALMVRITEFILRAVGHGVICRGSSWGMT